MSLNYCKQFRKIQNDTSEPSLPIKHHKKGKNFLLPLPNWETVAVTVQAHAHHVSHIWLLIWLDGRNKQNKQHKLLKGQLLVCEALHCATLVPNLHWLFSYQQGCCHWQIVQTSGVLPESFQSPWVWIVYQLVWPWTLQGHCLLTFLTGETPLWVDNACIFVEHYSSCYSDLHCQSHPCTCYRHAVMVGMIKKLLLPFFFC